METHAEFQTERASRYLVSLCQHFGHKLPVELKETTGRIEFPFGQCNLESSEARLRLDASAATRDDLDKVVEVVTSHLERFAFRENPNIKWQSA